jgi:hypothetical protein
VAQRTSSSIYISSSQVLHLIMGLERLDRITAFITEVDEAKEDAEDAAEPVHTPKRVWEASPPGGSTTSGADPTPPAATMQRSASLLARATMRIKAAASFTPDPLSEAMQRSPLSPRSPRLPLESGNILKRASERMLRASASARARRPSTADSSDSATSADTPRGFMQLERPRPQTEDGEVVPVPRSAVSEIGSHAGSSTVC